MGLDPFAFFGNRSAITATTHTDFFQVIFSAVPIPAQDVYDPAELVQEIASSRSGKPVLPPLNLVFVFLMYLLLQYRLTQVMILDIYISGRCTK